MAEAVGRKRKHFVYKSTRWRLILLGMLVIVIAAFGTSNGTYMYLLFEFHVHDMEGTALVGCSIRVTEADFSNKKLHLGDDTIRMHLGTATS